MNLKNAFFLTFLTLGLTYSSTANLTLKNPITKSSSSTKSESLSQEQEELISVIVLALLAIFGFFINKILYPLFVIYLAWKLFLEQSIEEIVINSRLKDKSGGAE